MRRCKQAAAKMSNPHCAYETAHSVGFPTKYFIDDAEWLRVQLFRSEADAGSNRFSSSPAADHSANHADMWRPPQQAGAGHLERL
jgi:hypothetical protein